jgi:hypothetical protein
MSGDERKKAKPDVCLEDEYASKILILHEKSKENHVQFPLKLK